MVPGGSSMVTFPSFRTVSRKGAAVPLVQIQAAFRWIPGYGQLCGLHGFVVLKEVYRYTRSFLYGLLGVVIAFSW